jgi:tetratricopeptide (TPR) repeat protein
LRKSGKKRELEAVSTAFETFLDRITKSDTPTSLSSLNWVAETYFSLASGLSEGSSLDPKVAAYFKKAAAVYSQMLEVAQKDPQFKDQPDRLIAMRMRLADCYRHSDNFDDATKTILAVVRERPTLVTAQVQAAEIYQARGAVDPKGYFLAITGAEPGRDGANSIWGWAKLSQMTAGKPMFAETFHHARLSMATARYRYALAEKDRKKAIRILEAAKQDLWLTYKLHPDLGGDTTLARYDKLLKQIQKNMGGKETGLEEFKQRETASTTTLGK